MSQLGAIEPVCTRFQDKVDVLVEGRSKDLGGFSVRRILPAPMVRRVGPFVFFDVMGPADFPPGKGINVRPHPHIGLATVTYLFAGEILHRDSLGFVQAIQPGAVNLMTAGKGIVHSERTDPALERAGQRLHGLQVWMALPADKQEIDPEFVHYPKAGLPVIDEAGVTTTVIIGRYGEAVSPVRVHAETLYLDQQISPGVSTMHDPGLDQLAVYVVSGQIRIGQSTVEAGVMAVLTPGDVTFHAQVASRVIVIGGEDVGPREMFWNFVHTSKERIQSAKQDWRNGKFAPVPGDDEFIPLPD